MHDVDSLIIAAVPEEFTAAREAAERLAGTTWARRDGATAEPYLLGRFGDLTVALARPPGMGSREGGQFVATLADRVRPRSLAMCGVCAGHPDETALGDVIVAELAYQYDEGKQTSTSFRPDHRQYLLSATWKRAAQDFDPAGLPSHRAATPDDGDTWLLSRIRQGRGYLDHPANERFPGTPSERLDRLIAAGLVADGRLTPAGVAELERRARRTVNVHATLYWGGLTWSQTVPSLPGDMAGRVGGTLLVFQKRTIDHGSPAAGSFETDVPVCATFGTASGTMKPAPGVTFQTPRWS